MTSKPYYTHVYTVAIIMGWTYTNIVIGMASYPEGNSTLGDLFIEVSQECLTRWPSSLLLSVEPGKVMFV